VAPVAAAQGQAAEREHQAVAVVEVTLTRPVESGADHRHTAESFAAELAGGTGEGWQESTRRVKNVRVTPVQ
jgi:hypothetical protein